MSPYRIPATVEPESKARRAVDYSLDRGLVVGWLLILFGMGAQAFVACDRSGPTSAQVAAEASYGAALLKCVDESKTLAESKACRAKVDAAWGVVQTGRDAGHDAN